MQTLGFESLMTSHRTDRHASYETQGTFIPGPWGIGQVLLEAHCPAFSDSHEAIPGQSEVVPVDISTTHHLPQDEAHSLLAWDPLWGLVARPWAVKTELGGGGSASLAVQSLGLPEDVLHG